jgi:ABC-type branched-subunit amino acid transport system substrate-binding protein
MLRAGIFLPRSTLFPSLNKDFFQALKENLKQQVAAEEIQLLIENIGFGIDESEIYSKAEKMLLQEDVDLLVVFADSRITELLQPLFTAYDKILLMVHFGANLPDGRISAPTTITHSLNFCFHTSLTAKLAVTAKKKEAINLISYYDGGYAQCYTMLHTYQSLGGQPVFNHITKLKISEFSLQPLAEYLQQNEETETILCLFAGEQAEQFYREIGSILEPYNCRLYVSPMMLEVSLKKLSPETATVKNVQGYIPWHQSLKNENNEFFKTILPNDNNYFSVLGWDTGILLHAMLEQKKAGNTKAAETILALTGQSFPSPRGWIRIDPATNQIFGPSYLAAMGDSFGINVLEEIKNTETAWEEFKKISTADGEISSWRNTYLCI